MNDKKSYYAIIPADVRYDEKLCANAKLLYGEITALCNEKGYCWASNDYFANLYKVSKKSISTWINQLKKYGYVSIKYEYKQGTNQILNRYVSLIPDPMEENFQPYGRKLPVPMEEKVKENNTYNNTYNNTGNKKRQSGFTVPTLNDILSYISEQSLSVDGTFFLKYYTESNWVDSNGKKVINWKLKLLTWDKQNKTRKQKELDKRTGIDYPEL